MFLNLFKLFNLIKNPYNYVYIIETGFKVDRPIGL